ncbi:MAG: PhnD/SsuA/transferrin family substrate-binding protein [Methylomonas sp.]
MIKFIFLTLLFAPPAAVTAAAGNYLEPAPHLIIGVYMPGINDEANIKDIRVAMDYWIQELTRDLNIVETRTQFFTDITEMSQSFSENNLDMIIEPGLSIIKYFKLSDLGVGFRGIRKNEELNSLILLVNNNGAIGSLADLRGKNLTMADNDELSEIYIDTLTRTQFNRKYGQFFGNININKKNSRLILDLFFGKTDAVLVYLKTYDVMAELNPQIKTNTKILLSYPISSKIYCFFRRDFPYTERIIDNLKTPDFNARIGQILELFKTEEFVITGADDLLPIKKLYDDYKNISTGKK